ncbi:MAG TPA: UDP-4-amino-4,6-dideoxy-N-acetyl-beta-L-altrosamine N-acetyltransferase [Caulobacteraceae bacterium]|nr:UDP-4-amino-4,6-dideoxy-N-acetyl-beta-L-altrosamine N-acetyltransferase [Caulobacteraceae bacterium]
MGVTLRRLRPEDKDRLLAWRNSPEVAPYMYSDHVISGPEHEAWFAALEGDPRRAYWIIELNGSPVGLVNLYDIDERNGRAAWAYYLANPAVRGQGVGAQIEFAMLDHVFIARGLNKLWCEVLAENEAVWKLHLSFGFKEEARLRAHVTKGGLARDVVGLGLLAEDWKRVRPDCEARLKLRRSGDLPTVPTD